MPTRIRENGRKPLLPIARLLAKSRISPNLFTLIGFIITIFAGFLYGKGAFLFAGITLIVAGLFDILDGDIARISKKVTKFGAFLDSTLDRYSDFAILMGMFYYYYYSRNTLACSLVLLTILGSYLVSYTRARAESLGESCKVGIGDRAIRIIIIIIGSFFGPRIFVAFLGLLAVLTNLTAIYRIYYVWKQLKLRRE